MKVKPGAAGTVLVPCGPQHQRLAGNKAGPKVSLGLHPPKSWAHRSFICIKSQAF